MKVLAPKKPITWSLAWDYAAFSELIFRIPKVQPLATVATHSYVTFIDTPIEGTES